MVASCKCVRLSVFVMLAIAGSFSLEVAHAQTLVVGNCKSQQQFKTIGAAVAAATPGATVEVCPGTYPEQVAINMALTLKGISSGNQGAAIITTPAGGVQTNAYSLTSGKPIAAQIVAAGAGPVAISNMTVDGSNNGLSDCSVNLVGIYYQNSSGSITRSAALNQALSPSLNGCQGGLGIFVQSGSGGTSAVTITNNHVENYQKNGITGNEAGTNVTISGNTVTGQGPTNGAGENSVQIGFGATGSISGNTVGSDVWAPDTINDPGDAAAGLLVYDSAGISITKNNVNETQFGIAVVSDGTLSADNATITNNTVSATHIFDGIDLCGTKNNTVTGNIINGSDEAAVHIDGSCGASTGSTVKNNTINTACAGVLIGNLSSAAVDKPNAYYNTMTLVQNNGSDSCTPPPGAKSQNRGAARDGAHVLASRP